MVCNHDGVDKTTACFIIFHIIGGLGLLIAGALAVDEVSNIQTDNTKPLLDPILYDFNQAGRKVLHMFILVITTGVLNVLAAVFGFVWRCKKGSLPFWGLYTFTVFVAFITQLTFIVFLFTTGKKVEGDLKEIFMAVLKENFIEDTTSNIDPISNAWNHMFMTLDCCGVNPVLSVTNDFDQTPWCTTLGACKSSISQIPKTCCTGVDETIYSSAPESCHGNVTSGTYNAQGCYEVIKMKLLFQLWSSVFVLIGAFIVLLIELIAMIVAFVICYKNKSEKKTDTTPEGTRSSSVSGVQKSSTEMSDVSDDGRNTDAGEKR